MNSLDTFTHSTIELPTTPTPLVDMEALVDDVLDLIDEALQLMEEQP
jgi:hypothetical protein